MAQEADLETLLSLPQARSLVAQLITRPDVDPSGAPTGAAAAREPFISPTTFQNLTPQAQEMLRQQVLRALRGLSTATPPAQQAANDSFQLGSLMG
jgi:hypothetical protein